MGPLRALPQAGRADLMKIYRRLRRAFGHAGWWPGDSAFEICIGAILTQNTAWTNVEKALLALRSAGRLSFDGLRDASAEDIAPLIRSSGVFNVKARRLASFIGFLAREYGGDVAAMAREHPQALRAKLLGVFGVGRETADSIALYAAGLPLFVVDAYTRRIFARLGFLRGDEPYDAIQRFFESRLPEDAALFNDYHAQLVRLAKEACRANPLCERCPIEDLCAKRGLETVRGESSRTGTARDSARPRARRRRAR
jgi:endonuclease-3 related protein